VGDKGLTVKVRDLEGIIKVEDLLQGPDASIIKAENSEGKDYSIKKASSNGKCY